MLKFAYKYILHFACYMQVFIMGISILTGDFNAALTAATFAFWAWLAWDYRRQRDENADVSSFFIKLVDAIEKGEVKLVRTGDNAFAIKSKECKIKPAGD